MILPHALLSVTAFSSTHESLLRISGLSDLPIVQLWYSFMSGALSSPWDLVLECNPEAWWSKNNHSPTACASQLPSAQANYLLVLGTYYLYHVLLLGC
jgi:hypothetical protein